MAESGSKTEYPSQDTQGEVASKESTGPSLFVSPTKDLVAKPGANLDSWFLVGDLDSSRGKIYLLVQFLHVAQSESGKDLMAAMVSLLDPRTGRYVAEEQDFSGDQCTFGTDAFNVVTPMAQANGSASSMMFKGKWGKTGVEVEITAEQSGPMLPNMGGGLFPCLGGSTYHYALATMTAAGAVTIGGDKYDVAGSSWLDRQWGITPRFFGKESKKWAWFSLALDNGDRISVWEFLEPDRPLHSWATVVRADGGVDVVGCEPLTANASRIWKSHETDHVYPTSWDIRIPQLSGHISVIPEVIEQEFISPAGMHKYEGFSPASGTLRGKQVSGRAMIELVGDWV